MIRLFALVGAIVAFCVAGAGAQVIIPISQLPQASPSPGDVFPFVHGGVLGVGGVTSKATLTQMLATLGPIAILLPGNTANYTQDYSYNSFAVTQDNSTAQTVADNAHIYGFSSYLTLGGTNTGGEHDALKGYAILNAAHSATTNDTDTVGVIGGCEYKVNDGGTSGTPRGTCYGMNAVAGADVGASYLSVVTALETETALDTGASSYERYGVDAISVGNNQASAIDAGFALLASASPSPAWKDGIELTNASGAAPVSGTIFGTDGSADTVSEGIDFSSYTFSSYEINFGNFSVDQSGNATAHGALIGQETINSASDYVLDLTSGTKFYRRASDGAAVITSQSGLILAQGCVVMGGSAGTLGTAWQCGGSGVPSFSAPNGSEYQNYSGGAGARFYINTSGASTSGTTWTAEF